jgi:hypothetical protein
VSSESCAAGAGFGGLSFVCLSSDNFRSKIFRGLSGLVGHALRGVLSAGRRVFGGRAPKVRVCVKWLFDNDERDGNEPIDWRWEADCSS